MAKSPGRPPGRPRKSPLLNRPDDQYAAPALEEREPLPNFDLLDDLEKDELRKKAVAKVEAQEKDRAMEAYLKAEVDRIERDLHPEAYEEEKEILIDLAIYADRLIINGRHYMHGRTYTVKKGLYDAMVDIMAHTHKHYRDTHRDPARAAMEASQAIAKGGPSYATINGSTGQVMKF